MSLKAVDVYDVSVTLHDESSTAFVLLTPPTAEAVREGAKAEGTREMEEAARLLSEVNLPSSAADPGVTVIRAAGIDIGNVTVTKLTAYQEQKRRGRPKGSVNRPKGEEQT